MPSRIHAAGSVRGRTPSAHLRPLASAADITKKIRPGGPAVTATTSTAGDNVALTFARSATTANRVYVRFTNNAFGTSGSCSVVVSLRKPPDNSLLNPPSGPAGQCISYGSSYAVDTTTLPVDGTYTIYVDPQGNNIGSLTVTLYDVPLDQVQAITPISTGATATATASAVGQNAYLRFDVLVGQSGRRVFIRFSNNGIGTSGVCTALVLLDNPRGLPMNPPSGAGGICIDYGGSVTFDTTKVDESGTYTIVVDPQGLNTGSLTVTTYDVPADQVQNVTPTQAGTTVTASTAAVGQSAYVTFNSAATSAGKVFVRFTNNHIGTSGCTALVFLVKPNGIPMNPPSGAGGICVPYGGGVNFDTTRLPADSPGTYSIAIDPGGTNIGSLTVTVYDVPPDQVQTITPTQDTTTITAATGAIGQDAYITFNGSTGQRAYVQFTNNTYGTSGSCWGSVVVWLIKPNGFALDPPSGAGGSCVPYAGSTTFNWTPLPMDGTYTIYINPQDMNTGSLTVAVKLTPGGPGVKITGFANVGEVLVTTANFTTPQADSVAYQWQRCSAAGTSCVDLFGQTSAVYTVADADLGSTLRVKATGTNINGSTTLTSPLTPVVLGTIDSLALAYRPALLFDTGEHYRPITVESMLAEGDHRRCDEYSAPGGFSTYCNTISSISDLTAAPVGTPVATWLSIWPYGGASDGYHDYRCPSGNFIRDCYDSLGMFYDYGQSAGGYRYIDYWFFYRYNPVANDDHEGDWEGVTLEINPAPAPSPAIYGIVLAEHNKIFNRLASVFLNCPDLAASTAVCDNSPAVHAGIFVASGSHASYEYSCTSNCPNPATSFQDEGSHDGQSGWPGAVDPPTRFASWVSWGGRWGGSGTLIGSIVGLGDSPISPGASPNGRYGCTQVAWTCSTVPEGSPMPPARRTSRVGAAQPEAAKPPRQSRCATWFDTGLTAFACSPTQLMRAVRAYTLPKRGQFTLRVAGHRTGTAPGLVQVVGPPLKLGEVVRMSGKLAKDEIVILNTIVNDREYLIRLSRIRMGSRATARVALAGGRARPILRGVTAKISVTLVRPGRTG
jgi:hypothetical protein